MPRSNRAYRKRREVARIVGSLRGLPQFFIGALYNLRRAGLADTEVRRAYERCRIWTANARKRGAGECECGCQTRLPVNAVNAQQVSVWCLDHCKHTKTFRGILYQRCNMEIGAGDRRRKLAHVNYVLAHEARLWIAESDVVCRDEFQAVGAIE